MIKKAIFVITKNLRMSKLLLLISTLLITLASCDSLIYSPDQAADNFIKSIQNKDYKTTYLMLSESRRATIDTANPLAMFNLTNTRELNSPVAISLQKSEKLVKSLYESANFSHQKTITNQNPGTYTMLISTYDPEEILKGTLLELEKNASVVDLLRYSIMTEEQQYQLLEEKALEYINNTDSIPRKITKMPFTVSHNGLGYVID